MRGCEDYLTYIHDITIESIFLTSISTVFVFCNIFPIDLLCLSQYIIYTLILILS